MSQETLNLIIGAAISLTSTIFVLILSNMFQSKRDERTRQQKIEDEKLSNYKVILERRINQLEIFITDVATTLNVVSMELPARLKSYPKKKQLELIDKFYDDLGVLVHQVEKNNAITIYLDKEVNECFGRLINKIGCYLNFVSTLREYVQENVYYESYFDEYDNSDLQFQFIYAHMLVLLDEKRYNLSLSKFLSQAWLVENDIR